MPLRADFVDADATATVHAQHHNDVAAVVNALGDGKPTLLTPPSSANAKDDEFNDASGMSGPVNGLNAKWSKRNLATASWIVLDDNKAPGALLLDIPTGQAADQAIYQAVPAGDFRAVVRFEPHRCGDRQMWAVLIVDTSGNGVGVNVDTGDNAYIRNITAWQQTTGTATVATGVSTMVSAGYPFALSLRQSGTSYFGGIAGGIRVRPAGMNEVSFTPTAFTPAYVGFGRIFGTGVSKCALDFFRVT